MSIREISRYIAEHKEQLSREELWEDLKKHGYANEDIETAFTLDRFSGVKKTREKGGGVFAWEAFAEKKIPEGGESPITELKKVRAESPKEKVQFFLGWAAPTFFYLVSVFLLSLARFLLPPLPSTLILIWIWACAGIACSMLFRMRSIHFASGLPYGVIIVFVVGFSLLFFEYSREISGLL